MPATIVHLVGVERLSLAPGGLPKSVSKALSENLEYARFGAALLDLPWYGNAAAELARLVFGHSAPIPPMLPLLHEAPVAVGWKMGEVISRGALVGREAGLAVLTGYFSHLALERSLLPLVLELVGQRSPLTREAFHVIRGVEWVQALLWLRDTLGYDPMGTAEISQRFRVVKRRGLPMRGLGRGLVLLFRTACESITGRSPSKAEMDRWVRGLWVHGRVLGSSVGRSLSLPEDVPEATLGLYRRDDLDIADAIEGGLDRARDAVARLYRLIDANDFSDQARRSFLRSFPEWEVKLSLLSAHAPSVGDPRWISRQG